MMTLSLNQFLVLYMWFPLAALLSLTLLIARFYERFSEHRTYYQWYLLPIIFLGASSVRYASLSQLTGDIAADFLIGISGIVVIVLVTRLYRLMIVQNKKQPSQPEQE